MSVLCHLALRMITKHGLEQCLEMYKNKDKLPIYKLCTLSKQRDSKDFLYRTLMAAFMLRCLQVVDFFPNKNINEGKSIQFYKLKKKSLMDFYFWCGILNYLKIK